MQVKQYACPNGFGRFTDVSDWTSEVVVLPVVPNTNWTSEVVVLPVVPNTKTGPVRLLFYL